jgi:hypothetical protein
MAYTITLNANQEIGAAYGAALESKTVDQYLQDMVAHHCDGRYEQSFRARIDVVKAQIEASPEKIDAIEAVLAPVIVIDPIIEEPIIEPVIEPVIEEPIVP